MLTPARRILFENSPLYYPFGNTGAENILKDFNFQLDEIKVNLYSHDNSFLLYRQFGINHLFCCVLYRSFFLDVAT